MQASAWIKIRSWAQEREKYAATYAHYASYSQRTAKRIVLCRNAHATKKVEECTAAYKISRVSRTSPLERSGRKVESIQKEATQSYRYVVSHLFPTFGKPTIPSFTLSAGAVRFDTRLCDLKANTHMSATRQRSLVGLPSRTFFTGSSFFGAMIICDIPHKQLRQNLMRTRKMH